MPSKASVWLALSSGSAARSALTSGRRKTSFSSRVMKPWFTSEARLCFFAPENSRRSCSSARPTAQSVFNISLCCGALPRLRAAASAASSPGTAREAIVTYLPLWRIFPPLNQKPAGRAAFTAS